MSLTITMRPAAAVVGVALVLAFASVANAQEVFAPVNYVIMDGRRWATLDNAMPNELPNTVCDQTPRTLPEGWTIADPDDPVTLMVLQQYYFANWAVLLDDGSLWTTGSGAHRYHAGPFLTGDNTDGWTFPWCVLRILVVGPLGDDDQDEEELQDMPELQNTIVFDGFEYALIDDTAFDDQVVGCQSAWTSLRTVDGWTISPWDEGAMIAFAGRPAGTQCVLTSDGAFDPRNLAYCGAQLSILVGYGGEYYKPTGCNVRIAVRRPATAGAVDSWTWSVPEMSNTISSGGRDFGTLDNHEIDGAWGCQRTMMSPMDGWTLADGDHQGMATAITFQWGTWCMHTTTGGRPAGNPITAAQCTQPGQYLTHVYHPGLARHFYMPQLCDHRVMVSRATPSDNVRLGLRVLVLRGGPLATRPAVDIVHTMLHATEVPYDAVDVSVSGLPALFDPATGDALYAAIFLSDSNLLTDSGAIGLSALDQATLNSYAARFHVRLVSMNTWAGAVAGLSPLPGTSAAFSLAFDASVTQDLTYPAPTTAVWNVPAGHSWLSPATPSGGVMPTNVTPLLTLANDPAFLAAVIEETMGGDTATLHFFFSNSVYTHLSVLVDTAVNWALRGMIPGRRFNSLNMHCDDLGLETEVWVVDENRPGDSALNDFAYRATGADLDHLAAFQTWSDTSLAPPGSLLRIEHAVNYNGFNEHGGWSTVPGSLYASMLSHVSDFFWVSHTWTHLDLTCPESDCPTYGPTTYSQATTEVNNNIEEEIDHFHADAVAAGYAYARSHPSSTFSPASMVTPKISGLFNPSSLQAIWDGGHRSVVGDNSRSELAPADAYGTYVTTTAVNGYDGIVVMPRFATNIYFDVSLPDELLGANNYLYGPGGSIIDGYYSHMLTLSEMMTIEKDRVLPALLQHRHDPYMFHQANLRLFPLAGAPISDQASLISDWAYNVISAYSELTLIPLRSLKMDDLRAEYDAREDRIACDARAMMNINAAGVVTSLEITSAGACQAQFTNINLDSSNASHNGAVTYGSETVEYVQTLPSVVTTIPVVSGVTFA